jgi:hypothetical protein
MASLRDFYSSTLFTRPCCTGGIMAGRKKKLLERLLTKIKFSASIA